MLKNTIVLVLLLGQPLAQQAFANSVNDCAKLFLADQRQKAYQICLPFAQVGDPNAAFILARLYAKGLSGEPEWDKVVEWLSLASANGHAEAAYNLAIAYQQGKGTGKDIRQAVQYYQQSADAGNAKAMRNLASLYEQGEDLPQDLPRAFSLYQASAESGLSDSQLKTGIMLLKGIGTSANPTAARFWFDSAAEAGNDQAQLALGVLLIDLEPDIAVGWYKKAVKNGNPYAAYNLAVHYSEDKSIQQDLLQALAYADNSLSLGNTNAQPLYDKILKQLEQEGDVTSSSPTPSKTQASNTQLSEIQPFKAKSVKTESHKGPDDFYLIERNRNWLRSQPADRFVIQLARLTTVKSVKAFIHETGLQNKAQYLRLKEKDFIVLYHLDFQTDSAARKIIKRELSGNLAGDAWVRRYRSLY